MKGDATLGGLIGALFLLVVCLGLVITGICVGCSVGAPWLITVGFVSWVAYLIMFLLGAIGGYLAFILLVFVLAILIMLVSHTKEN